MCQVGLQLTAEGVQLPRRAAEPMFALLEASVHSLAFTLDEKSAPHHVLKHQTVRFPTLLESCYVLTIELLHFAAKPVPHTMASVHSLAFSLDDKSAPCSVTAGCTGSSSSCWASHLRQCQSR